MKKFASATLILLASTLAMAAQANESQPALVLAENTATTNELGIKNAETEKVISMKTSEKVLRKTLDSVSAELTAELDVPFEALFTAQ